MTFQPPSNYLPTTLPPPEMAEMRKLEVTTGTRWESPENLGANYPSNSFQLLFPLPPIPP